ncbi:hypothetical protein Tco_1445057 [Tanacetum coccineum]
MNQNYYDPNLCYNFNSSNFDQYQHQQYSVTHQTPMAELLLEEKLHQALQALCEKLDKNVQEKQEEKNECSIPLRDIISELPLSVEITPDLPITNSLIIEDEHLNIIQEMKSDEENESSVKDLNLTPSESEDLSDYESECDVPICDDSSSKNECLDDIVSIPPGKEIDHLDAIPNPVQSLLNHANSIIFLIEEFVGKLAPIDPIPPGIVEADFDPKEDIRIIENLLNDNSSPYTSGSLIEEIDIFLAPDDLIPTGIENDDYDLEGDVLFLEELLNDDSIFLPEYESFHFDFPSSPRPLEKPLDDDVYFDIEPIREF